MLRQKSKTTQKFTIFLNYFSNVQNVKICNKIQLIILRFRCFDHKIYTTHAIFTQVYPYYLSCFTWVFTNNRLVSDLTFCDLKNLLIFVCLEMNPENHCIGRNLNFSLCQKGGLCQEVDLQRG